MAAISHTSSQSGHFTVCSYNVLNKAYIRYLPTAIKPKFEALDEIARIQQIVQNIYHLDPDVITLQELSVDSAEYLNKQLATPGSHTFKYKLYYKRHPNRSEGDGVAILVKKDFDVLGTDKEETPHGNKGFISVTFLTTTHKTVRVSTGHLFFEHLIKNATQLINFSNKTSQYPLHYKIITGDFNFTETHDALNLFTHHRYISDGSRTSSEPFNGRRIDFIMEQPTDHFTSQQWPVTGLPFPDASDHLPIMTRFIPLANPPPPGFNTRGEIGSDGFSELIRSNLHIDLGNYAPSYMPTESSSSSSSSQLVSALPSYVSAPISRPSLGTGLASPLLTSSSSNRILLPNDIYRHIAFIRRTPHTLTDSYALAIYNTYDDPDTSNQEQFHAILGHLERALMEPVRQHRKSADTIPQYRQEVIDLLIQFLSAVPGLHSDKIFVFDLLESLDKAIQYVNFPPSASSTASSPSLTSSMRSPGATVAPIITSPAVSVVITSSPKTVPLPSSTQTTVPLTRLSSAASPTQYSAAVNASSALSSTTIEPIPKTSSSQPKGIASTSKPSNVKKSYAPIVTFALGIIFGTACTGITIYFGVSQISYALGGLGAGFLVLSALQHYRKRNQILGK